MSHPNVRTMLVSNYPEAQQEALAAGALPGFGKRELSTPRVTQLLRNAVQFDLSARPNFNTPAAVVTNPQDSK
jgi:hypothetical protein